MSIPATPLLPPVLVVDDDPNDVFFIRRHLDKAGVKNPVVTFIDSSDAQNYLQAASINGRQHPELLPCVMFLDIKMPKLTGFQLLQWVRDEPGLDPMITVMLSSSDEPIDRQRALELGAEMYLVKFPAPEVFAKAIADASQ